MRIGGSPSFKEVVLVKLDGAEKRKKMAIKNTTPKKTNMSKVLHKAKKLEPTKPLAFDSFLQISPIKK